MPFCVTRLVGLHTGCTSAGYALGFGMRFCVIRYAARSKHSGLASAVQQSTSKSTCNAHNQGFTQQWLRQGSSNHVRA